MQLKILGTAVIMIMGLTCPPVLRGAVISTRTYTPSVGTRFRVTVSGAFPLPIDLYAFQFDLSFNPAVIQLQAVSEGPFLPTFGGTTFFSPGIIDNTTGTVAFVSDTLIGQIPGAGGCGNCPYDLAYLDFRAISVGTSTLSFSNVIFLDSALNEMPSITSSGSVRVLVPEPVTSSLLWIAAAAMLSAKATRKLSQR